MEQNRKMVRQERLQKFSRILSNRYGLKLSLVNGMSYPGATDTKQRIFIKTELNDDDFVNLILQKKVSLHEMGHVLYTSSGKWNTADVDKSIANIIEDGRVEEGVSRMYQKARLYFVLGNQILMSEVPNRIYEEDPMTGLETEKLSLKRNTFNWLIREARKTTGAPPLPKDVEDFLKKELGSDYNWLKRKVKDAVFSKTETDAVEIGKQIDGKLNSLFPKNNWYDNFPNLSETPIKSIERCGSSARQLPNQKPEDEKLSQQLQKQIEKETREQEKNDGNGSGQSDDKEDNEEDDEGNSGSGDGEIEETDEEDGEGSGDGKSSGDGEETDDEGNGSDGETTDDDGGEDVSGKSSGDGGPGGKEFKHVDAGGEFEETENKSKTELEIIKKIKKQLAKEVESEIRNESEILTQGNVEADFSSYGSISEGTSYSSDNPVSTSSLEPVSNKIYHYFKTLAQNGRTYNPNQRRGKLDLHNLTSMLNQNETPRVFRKKVETPQTDLSCVILLDASGSMHGRPAWTATKSAYIMSRAMELCNFESEIVKFGVGQQSMTGVKSFNQKLTYIKRNFTPDASGGTPLLGALVGAEKSLARRNSKRKLIVVVTDGQPDRKQDCKKKINELENKGMMVVGITITNAYNWYWLSRAKEQTVFRPEHNLTCTNVDELPQKMTGVIKEVLMTLKRGA